MERSTGVVKIDVLLQGFSLSTDQGSIAFCGITLLEGSKRILVDVGHVGRRALLIEKLRERGLSPEDIDYVFLTHAHWDHMLNIDLFRNAKVLIHPAEREYCRQPGPNDWATPAYVTHILESRQLQEVREGEEVDDGVSVLETPGHSRGSAALLVRQDDMTVALSGDALPNSWSASAGVPRLVFWDLDAAKTSIRKLLDRAQAFYPGHDRPFLVGDGGKITYLQATNIRVFGWPEGGEGEGGPGLSYAVEAPNQANVMTR
jgi:glyoxylase-like metal-dependent hydrolase (beta-lactamase superfamily II)